jgi:hypothetical protein
MEENLKAREKRKYNPFVDISYRVGIHEGKMNGRKLESLRRKRLKYSTGPHTLHRGGIHEAK